jgi:hypothetical protein
MKFFSAPTDEPLSIEKRSRRRDAFAPNYNAKLMVLASFVRRFDDGRGADPDAPAPSYS